MHETTLCYIRRDGEWLMLHRVKREQDENAGKWIGVGGHVEEGETPEKCLLREVNEETGLTLTSWEKRGEIDFLSDKFDSERMHLYTADEFSGALRACDEGDLAWIPEEKLFDLSMWEGDRVFLNMLMDEAPEFRMTLRYKGDTLVETHVEYLG